MKIISLFLVGLMTVVSIRTGTPDILTELELTSEVKGASMKKLLTR